MLILFTASARVFAQSNEGSLAGTVYDPSGAVVSQAAITAVSEDSGTRYSTTTNNSGLYSLPQMHVGVYTITTTAPGFKTQTNNHVHILIATNTPLNVRLALGAATQTVTVNSNALALQTDSSVITGTLTAKQIDELPLSLGGQKGTRAPEAFTYLLPGTVAFGTGNGAVSPGFESSISGSQNFASEVLLDGADTFRSENGSTFDETSPSVDAIQEFTVVLSSPSAQYGRTTGGIEIFTTKSGTNHFHGGAYDLLQNTALNANTWFNNFDLSQNPADRSPFAVPIDRQNDYGLYVGGPVWLPKVYNGRNKSFAFFSWEQFNQHQSGTNRSFVPTLAERGGDFSADLGGHVPGDAVNPCTGDFILTGQIFDPSTQTTVGGTPCRFPFAGNKITTPISTVAQNVLKLLPPPNLLSPQAGTPNYVLRTTGLNLNTLYTVRIDQNLGQKHHVFFSDNARNNAPAVNLVFPLPLDTNSPQNFTTHFFRAGWTWTISPSLLNNFIVGFNRTNSQNRALEAAKGTTDWDKALGIGNMPPNTAFPQFGFNGNDNISGFGQNTNNDVIDNGWRINETFSWLRGNHSLTFGGQYYLQLFEGDSFSAESGNFDFSRNQTAPDSADTSYAGNSFASFLLGAVDSAQLTVHGSQPKYISHYYNLFVQDSWKATPTLTLNYGLSYSVETPHREAHGNTSDPVLTAPNPGADNLPGALVFAGKGAGRNGNVNETWANTWHKDFAPRIGFSWAPAIWHNKAVLRGAYGIFYAPLQYGDFNAQNQDGFSVSPSKSGNGYDPAFNIDTGFPAYNQPPDLDPALDNFTSPFTILPSYGRPGMVQNWSLQLQQQLAPDLIFTLGYVGSRGHHLRSGFGFVNAIPQSDFALGTALNQPVSSQSAVPLPWATFPTSQTVAQALRPYPMYFNLNTGGTLENLGSSSYDALESTLQRRFSNGLTLLASYTWSKTMTDSETTIPFFSAGAIGSPGVQDPNHPKKFISQQSLPNNFVLSYLYELPFGKGKPFLNKNKVVNRIVGGWQVGAVQRYESGEPVSFGSATGVPGWDAPIHFLKTGEPIFNPAYKPHSRGFNPLLTNEFNAGAFADPNDSAHIAARGGAYGFGNFEPVSGDVRMPAYLDEDFSLNKTTELFGGASLFFQAAFLDALNRHNFSSPDTNPFGGSNHGGTFGTITGTDVGPRKIQLELKAIF